MVAQPEAEESASYNELIRTLEPMDVSGMDPDVASILSDYYYFNFTSEENWSEVESIRYEGELRVTGGRVFRFVVFKKKPNSTKIVMYYEGQPIQVMSYDGVDAWIVDLVKSKEVVSMSEADAMNFIRDSTTGGSLCYPQLKGKTIESKGTKVIRGRRCYELLVTLPNGQEVTSMIDATSFDEFQRITTNALNGELETTTNIGFKVVDKVRIPSVSELRVDGELRYTVEITDVKFNSGVTTWIFTRASVASMPEYKAGENLSQELLFPSKWYIGKPVADEANPLGSDVDSWRGFSPFAEPSKFDISVKDLDLIGQPSE